MNHTKERRILAVVAIGIVALFSSCTKSGREHIFCINGVWELQQVVSPDGYARHYPDNGMTWLRIYDDSCYYQCQVAKAPNGTMIYPAAMEAYTYIDKGQNEVIYLQGENTNPLMIVSDSTMTIQETGRRYTWKLCKDYDKKRSREIIGIIKSDAETEHEGSYRYVFSDVEDELLQTNHVLLCILVLVVIAFMLFLNYAYNLYKNKKRVEQELKLIEQEREALPEPVKQAMNTVADEFHNSNFYLSLRRRITNGERLRKDDWEGIEQHFKSVYPRFTSTLFSLYPMSQVEYQVCLLLKLNVTPSDMAHVLCKDTSSISSIRSRLYRKVFGKKGGSKDWDDFILSL